MKYPQEKDGEGKFKKVKYVFLPTRWKGYNNQLATHNIIQH